MGELLATLRDPVTIRERCASVMRAVEEERSPFFRIDRSRLEDAAARVERSIRQRYPDLNIPPHSRWRHFGAGGVDRQGELDALLAGHNAADRARAQIDLTVLSVLLGAGAGAQWRYVEQRGALDALALPVQRHGRDELMALLDQAASGQAAVALPTTPAPLVDAGTSYTGPEGLAVASFRAFVGGAFSAQAGDPCRADAATLKLIDAAALRAMFQASPSNPLIGLEGRAALFARLGQALQAEADKDGLPARPSLVVERLTAGFTCHEVTATALLQELLRTFTSIWTSGSMVKGVPAGDVWPHRWAGDATGSGRDPVTTGWVPFHKLSQWLAYSLVEPLQGAGVRVTGLQALTGLAECRNGGLLMDCGVIVPRHAPDLERTCKPGDELVIEWRALTVVLLDELAPLVRQRLGKSEAELPLGCLMQGGTWAAGRELAQELRGGAPPIRIDSDGTVF